MTRRRLVPAALAAAAALGAAGPLAGQMQHGGGTAPGAAPAARAVAIGDRGYAPSLLVVPPGTRVTWMNGGTRRHTVTAGSGAFDSGALGLGEEFSFTAPAATGRIEYHCSFHAYMQGTLVVSALSLEAPATVPTGGAARLSGEAPGVPQGTAVALESRTGGAWVQIAGATVGADATFAAATPPLTTRGVLRARIGEDVSPSVRVGVMPRVRAARAGRRALAVAVRPARAGGVLLERLDLDTYMWHPVRRVPLRAGRARIGVPGPGVFRVTATSPGRGLTAASSPAVAFR